MSNALSNKLNVDYVALQGSVLGPILFTIYVHDIADKLNVCSLIQYGDCTQFLLADTVNNFRDLISQTEDTLHNVKQCFLSNGLLLNPKKRQCIFIGNR